MRRRPENRENSESLLDVLAQAGHIAVNEAKLYLMYLIPFMPLAYARMHNRQSPKPLFTERALQILTSIELTKVVGLVGIAFGALLAPDAAVQITGVYLLATVGEQADTIVRKARAVSR